MNLWGFIIFFILVVVIAGGGFMVATNLNMNDDLVNAKTSEKTLSSQLADAKVELEKTIKDRDALAAQIKTLEDQVRALNDQLEKLSAQISDYMTQINSLSQANDELNAALSQRLADNNDLVKQNTQMNATLQDQAQQLTTANETVMNLQKKVDGLAEILNNRNNRQPLESTLGLVIFAGIPVSGAILLYNNNRKNRKTNKVHLELSREEMHKIIQLQRGILNTTSNKTN